MAAKAKRTKETPAISRHFLLDDDDDDDERPSSILLFFFFFFFLYSGRPVGMGKQVHDDD